MAIPERDEALAAAIRDAERQCLLAVLSETETDILTDDLVQGRIVNYRLVPPTADWIKSRVLVMPAALEMGAAGPDLVAGLLLSVDPGMLATLRHIVVAAHGDDEAAICRAVGIDKEDFPDAIDLEAHAALGCYWRDASSVVVDLTAIRNAAEELADELRPTGFVLDIAAEAAAGLLTTILHEIRHLGLDDPFLEGLPWLATERTEAAVEAWAQEAYDAWALE